MNDQSRMLAKPWQPVALFFCASIQQKAKLIGKTSIPFFFYSHLITEVISVRYLPGW
jgi:hypothetical protein